MPPRRDDTRTITLVVPFKSNLDLLARGSIGALNKLADAIGGGLRAVALALSTKEDNSAAVQVELDKQAEKMNASAAAIEEALANFNKPKEGKDAS